MDNFPKPTNRPNGPRAYDAEASRNIGSEFTRKKSLVKPERSRMEPSNPQYHYAQAATQQGSRIHIQPSTTGNDPAAYNDGLIPLQDFAPISEETAEDNSDYNYRGPRDHYGLNDEIANDNNHHNDRDDGYEVEGTAGEMFPGENEDEFQNSNSSDDHTQVSEPLTSKEIEAGGAQANRHSALIPPKPIEPGEDYILSPWRTYCRVITFWAPSPLMKLFGMKTKDRQMAWREKIGLITVIMYVAAFVAYLTFGFTATVCKNDTLRLRNGEVSTNYMIINGLAYDLSSTTHPAAAGIERSNVLYPPVNAGGMDGSFLFQNVNGHCKGLITPKSNTKITHDGENLAWYFPCRPFAQNGTTKPNFTVSYYEGWSCHTSSTARNLLYHRLKPTAEVYFTWDDIKNSTRDLIVFNGNVLDTSLIDWLLTDELDYPVEFDLIRSDSSLRGVDVSQFMSHGRDRQIAKCLNEIIKVGVIDTDTIGCIASKVVLYVSLVFILGLVAAKFVLACYFKFFMAGKQGAFYMDRKQLDEHNEEIEDWSNDINTPAPINPVVAPPRRNKFSQQKEKNRQSVTMMSQIPITSSSKVVPGSSINHYRNASSSRNSLVMDTRRKSIMSSDTSYKGALMDEDNGPFTSSAESYSEITGPSGSAIDYLVPQPPVGYQPFGFPLAHTICLVTAYSESVDGLRTTLDSLATTEYPNSHKLLFVVCDGLIKGSGNDMTTPEICLSMMKDFAEQPEDVLPHSYVSVVTGSKRHNMAKIYSGFYDYDNSTVDPSKQQRVPMILVVKCGTPAEANLPKPGNRGKRDSQIILMSFLQKVMFDDRMTELEYEMFNGIWKVTGIAPDFYEIVLMVDADTKVFPDSLTHMVAQMVKDPEIMGLCGETKIANKGQSWVTWIQVFEYFISHHQAKAFESVFGGVTCLPGCFCMYRIKAPKGDDGFWVPILANPDIVERYSDNVVDTLHKKNLLLLGEDRFLTTLMLKTFPKRKQIFMPKAACKTVVPDEFKVLLSQRRRWINSTVHNLMELVLVRDLCGVFCISMQFVVFIDLISTLVLPAAIAFTLYVVVIATYKKPTPVLSLVLLALILGLPGVLIVVTATRVSYVGWMLIYLCALPIWNFVLPMNAYWKFDDFSWGDTRTIAGGDKGGHDDTEGEFDSSQIVMKHWKEFQKERRRPGPFSAPSMNGSHTMSLMSSASYLRSPSRMSYSDNALDAVRPEENL